MSNEWGRDAVGTLYVRFKYASTTLQPGSIFAEGTKDGLQNGRIGDYWEGEWELGIRDLELGNELWFAGRGGSMGLSK